MTAQRSYEDIAKEMCDLREVTRKQNDQIKLMAQEIDALREETRLHREKEAKLEAALLTAHELLSAYLRGK